MTEQITLYTVKTCWHAQRVEIALAEAGANFTKFEIDQKNKPEWYALKVNPASMVPAVAYGGPNVPADKPSPDSVKIAESLVLLEFFADLFPESKLLPKDPVLRARARFFIDAVSTKLTPGWLAFVRRGESIDPFFSGAEALQALLPEDKTFAVSNDFTIADAAVAPILARAVLCIKNEIGAYAPGEGKKAYDVLNSARFSKLLKYYKAIEARESFKSAFDEELLRDKEEKRAKALKLAGVKSKVKYSSS